LYFGAAAAAVTAGTTGGTSTLSFSTPLFVVTRSNNAIVSPLRTTAPVGTFQDVTTNSEDGNRISTTLCADVLSSLLDDIDMDLDKEDEGTTTTKKEEIL
jgi:hypothetical protein